MSGTGHEVLPHTADAGIRAWAPDLAGVFAEAGRALAGVAADVDPVGPASATGAIERVALQAADLAALAYGWLNELVSLADARGAAIAGVRDVRVEPVADDPSTRGWTLDASVVLAPIDGLRSRRRIDVKSVTYHGLVVVQEDGRWTLEAYLDV
jgi:SHS2 domain-containing protein